MMLSPLRRIIARGWRALAQGEPDAPPSSPVDDYLARAYPDDSWRDLSPAAREVWTQYHRLFESHGIRTIAYVGANEGFTPLALREAFPAITQYLFEPLPHVFATLQERTAQFPNMHPINVAVGATPGMQEMFVDEYSMASSILPYTPAALDEFPFLGKQSSVEVPVKRLDEVLIEQAAESVDFLLMDVQGYEDEVLKGARETLRSCRLVVSELSLVPLYEGSSTLWSVSRELETAGFELQAFINPLPGTHQHVLQVDGIFTRS